MRFELFVILSFILLSVSVIGVIENRHYYFDEEFGIKTPQFFESTSFRSKNNHLFFGSPQGFYQLKPENLLQIRQQISQPIFTNLYVINKKIGNINVDTKTDDTFNLHKQLNSLDIVELAYKQSPVSFEFISPNAKLPTQLNYRYRLIGLETDWIDAAIHTGNNINRATYTNLSPGDYIFEVQAYDTLSPDNAKTSRLNVMILPPWWLSTTMLLV